MRTKHVGTYLPRPVSRNTSAAAALRIPIHHLPTYLHPTSQQANNKPGTISFFLLSPTHPPSLFVCLLPLSRSRTAAAVGGWLAVGLRLARGLHASCKGREMKGNGNDLSGLVGLWAVGWSGLGEGGGGIWITMKMGCQAWFGWMVGWMVG